MPFIKADMPSRRAAAAAASSKPNANPNRSRSRNLSIQMPSTRMLRVTKIMCAFQNLQLRVRTLSVRPKSLGRHSQSTAGWLNLCNWEKEQDSGGGGGGAVEVDYLVHC